jgi:hypothetical protein
VAGDELVDRTIRDEVRDLVAKGWLTHDAMWFDSAARSLGVGAANDLNRAAIRAMAPIEIRRLTEALGMDPSDLGDASAVAGFVTDGVSLLTPRSVSTGFTVSARDARTLHWEWEPGACFAWKGMTRLGWIDGYRCGVVYRVECWLEALGLRRLDGPAVEGCLMQLDGRCSGDLVLDGGGAAAGTA